jgi:hypothetical protein
VQDKLKPFPRMRRGERAGATYDLFFLIEQVRRWCGAALSGREIEHCEHLLTFVQNLCLIADGELGATEEPDGSSNGPYTLRDLVAFATAIVC